VQGSVLWWSRTHRAHHRYTDTPRDPYAIGRGLFHAHIGWTIFRNDLPKGRVDISDLHSDTVVVWQHKYYHWLAIFMGYMLPAVIPGVCWGDWAGGFYFAAAARLTLVHHVRISPESFDHDEVRPAPHIVHLLHKFSCPLAW
jgi:stearoyl-CoA desaturase (delta-9 desaturase)